MRRIQAALLAVLIAAPITANAESVATQSITVGPRPFALIDRMADGPLKTKLLSCQNKPPRRTLFSIGHRGAALQFPEHTAQSYKAAARMGAGIIECDVTFTRDKALVCRHAQNDLHKTTNILATDLAATCATPFKAATGGGKARAECRTVDLTLSEFKRLNGKMDAANTRAKSLKAYMDGTASWRTDLYAAAGGTVMTHAESIALLKPLGAKFTPELKKPVIPMPFDGFSQQDYAQKLIDEYKAAGVPPSDVWAQSFHLDDIRYWIAHEPAFGRQAVYIDGRYSSGINPNNPATFKPSMADLKAMGLNYISAPIWMLVTLEDSKIIPSAYAKAAKAAGLNIIAWTLERSGPLQSGGGWYYRSITRAITGDGDMYRLLHVLAQDVGVVGVFSDWPATVTYYASCFDLK